MRRRLFPSIIIGAGSSARPLIMPVFQASLTLPRIAWASGHNHHFLLDNCRAIGLKIEELEADQNLQEAVLSVHHSFMATFSRQNAIKIVENSAGATWAVGS